jgi:hypothetical protein
MAGNRSDTPWCVIGHMKKMETKNTLYKKIRQIGLTLGPVAAGVAGGPCNRLPSIKLRFHKGIKKIYCGNRLHLAIFHRIQGKRAFHNFNKITI